MRRSSCRAGWVSRLPDNPDAAIIRNHARGGGLDIADVVWVPYDGVGRADRVAVRRRGDAAYVVDRPYLVVFGAL